MTIGAPPLSKREVWMSRLRVPRRRWWFVATLLVMALFLFTPKSPENGCIHNITFFGAAVIPHNCDSVSMVNELADVGGYMTEPNVWKGRPVYLLSGYVLGQALMPIAKPVWAFVLNRNAEAQDYKKSFAKNFHLHVAFIFFNFLIVVASARYAIFLSGLRTSHLTAVALAVAVASVDLVEGFLYVLQTSLFNYVSAVGAAAYVAFGLTTHLRTARQEMGLGLLAGLGVLVYPAIAILLPAYLVGVAYGVLRWRQENADNLGVIKKCVSFVGGCVSLPLLWFVLNTYVLEVSTYATATIYGQFAWPLEAIREGNVAESVLKHLEEFAQALALTMKVELVVCAIGLLVLLFVGGKKIRSVLKDPVLFSLLIAALGVLGFNFLQGLYAPRMHIAILVLFYIALARIGFLFKQEKISGFVLAGLAVFQISDAVLHYSSQFS